MAIAVTAIKIVETVRMNLTVVHISGGKFVNIIVFVVDSVNETLMLALVLVIVSQ